MSRTGRPPDPNKRVRLPITVLVATKDAIDAAVDKKDPNANSRGRVVDMAFGTEEKK